MKVADLVAWWKAMAAPGADVARGLALFGEEIDRLDDLAFVEVEPKDERLTSVVLECEPDDPERWIGLQVRFAPGQKLDRERLARRFGAPHAAQLPIDYHASGVIHQRFEVATKDVRWLLLLLHAPVPASKLTRVESLTLRRDPLEGLEPLDDHEQAD